MQPTGPVPLDMLILLDRSASMNDQISPSSFTDRWAATTTAIQDFVEAPTSSDLSIGLQFFPLPYEGLLPVPHMDQGCELWSDDCGPYSTCQDNTFFTACAPIVYKPSTTCNADDYRVPAVPLTQQSVAADAIRDAIAAEHPIYFTPTKPAVAGALDYLHEYAASNDTGREYALVLATDGEPAGCGVSNTAARIGDLVAAALDGPNAVKTFVIGIGGHMSALNPIASRGGTNQPTFVWGLGTHDQILSHLGEVRNQIVGCRAVILPRDAGSHDYDKLNVHYTPPDGEVVWPPPPEGTWLPRVASAADCDDVGGWHYDDPDNPTQVLLCDSSCDPAAFEGGVVQIGTGCDAMLR